MKFYNSIIAGYHSMMYFYSTIIVLHIQLHFIKTARSRKTTFIAVDWYERRSEKVIVEKHLGHSTKNPFEDL
jgi:hypothetical protein